MEEREVEEGDCLGVSLGEPLVDGVEEDTALRRAMRLGTAVEAIAQVSIGRGQL